MKKVLLLGAVLAVMVSSAAQAVTLINDSLTAAPGAWTKVGNGPNAATANDRGMGGDWTVGGSDGSGHSPAFDNYYFQKFDMSGVYQIDASGLCKAWAGWWSGENWSWLQEARIELYVDGNKVAETVSKNDTTWDKWNGFSYSGIQTVNSNIELRLHSVKGNDQNGGGGLGAIWYASRYDDISLTATAVPEPSSLLALLTGAAGVAGFVIRRRR